MSLEDLLFPHRVIPKAGQRLRHRINVLSDESDDLDPRGDHRDSRLRRSEHLANKRNQTLRSHKKIQANQERKAKRQAYTNEWRKMNQEKIRAIRKRHNDKPKTRLYKRIWRANHYIHRGPKRGETSPAAKLNDAAVREMRALHAEGKISIRGAAKCYGVSFNAARKVIRRESWTHVTDGGENASV